MEQIKNKVVVYIDGFNLYFGMVEAGFNNCKWLNIEKLVQSYLTPNQHLVAIKFLQVVYRTTHKSKNVNLLI